MTDDDTDDEEEPFEKQPTRFDKGDAPPSDGGCWFCHSDDPEPDRFSAEFDTYYHQDCAETLGIADRDDPVLAFERGDHDRLFVPLNTTPYRWFESGVKDVEIRGLTPQYNTKTVYPGRRAELRRGYSTDDSMWGTIGKLWIIHGSLDRVRTMDLDHQRIVPDASFEEFRKSVRNTLGEYDQYIAFAVDLDAITGGGERTGQEDGTQNDRT